MDAVYTKKEDTTITQKAIFRLAAMLYTNTSSIYSSAETQLHMIKCVFVDHENCEMTYDEIVLEVLSTYKYHLTKDEIISIIAHNKEQFQRIEREDKQVFRLSEEVYMLGLQSQTQSIDSYIDAYIKLADISDGETCKEAIYQYLYELTTTSINSYKVLLAGKHENAFTDKELAVNLDNLSAEEKEMIRGFIEWESDEKNNALSYIALCCLEFCLLVNGDKPNALLKDVFRRREVFLDTNVVFQAIGIDGPARKKIICAFLNKCKQAKIKLIINEHTKKEFQESINHYITEIRSYPRGNIYLGAYEQLSGYSIYSFFNEWCQTHKSLSLAYFNTYINGLYAGLIKEYKIVDNDKIPPDIYTSDSFRADRNSYAAAIKTQKQEARYYHSDTSEGFSKVDSHDATIIRYIEYLREKYEGMRDVFFISTDKALRYWDITRRETTYPIVVYPSQLFLVLIKLCGRAENDFESFVSFINIRTNSHQISPEKANIIVSGISSITEDIACQKELVEAAFGGDFQNIIQCSNTDTELYNRTQEFSQRYLDDKLQAVEKKLTAVSNESTEKDAQIVQLEKETQQQQAKIEDIQGSLAEVGEKLREIAAQEDEKKDKICAFAMRKTRLGHGFKWFVIPIAFFVLCLLYIAFVLLQFFFCGATWNLATIVNQAISETTFGKSVDGYLAVVDGAIFTVLSLLGSVLLRKKPWKKELRDKDRQARMERYIERNHLL